MRKFSSVHQIMKIISTVELKPAHRAAISNAVVGAEIVDRQCRTEEEVNEIVGGGCDVMVTFRVPDDVADRAPGLRWIQLLSAGADHAIGAPLKAGKITFTTTSGIHATPIAEYTLASMLGYAHRFHLTIRAQTKHEWMRSGRFMATVDEIRGQTLGIIGYGSIGRETARLAQAFGMKVLALKRDPQVRTDPGWCPAGLGDPAGTIPERFFRSRRMRGNSSRERLRFGHAAADRTHAQIYRRARTRRDETERIPGEHRAWRSYR